MFYRSKCWFTPLDVDFFPTQDIKCAISLCRDGYAVDFEYDGKYVGRVVYVGTVATADELTNAPYGTIAYCSADNSYYASMPDEYYL